MSTPTTRRLSPDAAANESQASRSSSKRCGRAVARACRCELDVARVAACLATGATVADGDAVEARVAPQQDRVTESQLAHRGHLAAEVEAGEDLIRQPSRLLEERVAIPLAVVRDERVRADWRHRPRLLRGDDRQRPRPEAVLWYSPRCFGLSAKVKRPAWRTPQRSNASSAGWSSRPPMPRSQRSG